jgi:hypothetical protein
MPPKLREIPAKALRRISSVNLRFTAEKILGIMKSERLEVQMFGGNDAYQVFRESTRARLASLGVALAAVPESVGEVFRGKRFHEARRKRNRAIKAGFVVRKVTPMDHRDGIYAINNSAPVRQNRPMATYLTDLDEVRRFCETSSEIYGVFDDEGELRAYAHGILCGEVFVLDRFIGHRDALRQGVMFLLMHEVVTALVKHRQAHGNPRWVQHHLYFVSWDGARQFKKEAGFGPYRVKWSWDRQRDERTVELPAAQNRMACQGDHEPTDPTPRSHR